MLGDPYEGVSSSSEIQKLQNKIRQLENEKNNLKRSKAVSRPGSSNYNNTGRGGGNQRQLSTARKVGGGNSGSYSGQSYYSQVQALCWHFNNAEGGNF